MAPLTLPDGDPLQEQFQAETNGLSLFFTELAKVINSVAKHEVLCTQALHNFGVWYLI